MGACRIAVIGPSRDPIAEPFAGGLAAHVWTLTNALCERGHDVTLFGAPGSDPRLPVHELDLRGLQLSADARADVSMPAEAVVREHHAYLSLLLRLAKRPHRFDVIHNHSLHYLPVAMADHVGIPMLTTLHTPPTPWLESAVQAGNRDHMRFVAVSDFTAAQWKPLLGEVPVVGNGVDLRRWPVGPGGPDLVWTGRLVPEKAPHLAIAAARSLGRRITIAGPIGDPRYFADVVRPLLEDDVRYAGHLDQRSLAHLVGRSAVAVVTPVWPEPYGLVVAEALACGTPIAGFARGGVTDIVDETCARLIDDEDVTALANAIVEAERLSRAAARARAEAGCSMHGMVRGYEAQFDDALAA